MSATVNTYLELVDSETRNLTEVLRDSFRSGMLLSRHVAVLYFDTRSLCNEFSNTSVDSYLLNISVDQLIKRLSDLTEKTLSIHRAMPNHLFIPRWMIWNSYQSLDRLISLIIEREAKNLGIPSTDVSIDQIMGELNKPINKSMLDKSIAELNANNLVHHDLVHD